MEMSYLWGGTSTGDASEAPYDDDEFSDLWTLLHTYDRTTQGVIHTAYSGAVGNYLSSADLSTGLEVTAASGPTIRIARGAALVDGKLYVNDSRLEDPDGGITAPGAGSNYYRVVLRKDFAAQTVRCRLLGPNAAAPPAVTQTDGTTWEISLATIQITSGGTVTVTDVRRFLGMQTRSVFIPAIPYTVEGADAQMDRQDIRGWQMDDGETNRVYGSFVIPEDYHSDGVLSAVVLGASSGDISYYFQVAYEEFATQYYSNHTAQTSNPDTATIALSNTFYKIGDLEMSNADPGDMAITSMSRRGGDGSDTLDADLYCPGFVFTYVPVS